MAPTSPNQAAGQSQAQPQPQDLWLTNALRWMSAVSGTLCVMILAGLWNEFKETRDNQLKIGIIVDNLSDEVLKIEKDNDKQDSNYQRLLERQQMHHLAIQQIQSHLRLR